jgi:1,4-alpha-glucan branching enzyme
MNFNRQIKTAAMVVFVLGVVGLSIFGCGSGKRAGIGRDPSPEIVDGGAVFRFFDTDAKRVFLVGDFNNWSPKADAMKDLNGDGHWSLFYPLRPGTYQYKFVVDGRWLPDPHNPDSEPDGFDDINSVVKIPEASTTS